MPTDTNWDDLKFVLAVAEAGSVNAAAARLNVNHATILRRVAAFEDAHQTHVFLRQAKGYTVSPEAVRTIEAIRNVQRAVEAMKRTISSDVRMDGKIRLTSTDSLCQTVLPDIIANFHRTFPCLTIELLCTNNRLDLAKLDAEITIRPSLAQPDNLIGERACSMGFSAYGTRQYFENNISSEPEHHQWLGITQLLAKSNIGTFLETLPEDSVVFRSDSFITLANVAQTGLGIAILPKIVGDHFEKLVKSSLYDEAQETSIWVATHGDLASSPRINTCMRYFIDALAERDT